MVDLKPADSSHFNTLRKLLHLGLAHPWIYRMVRLALACLFIYGGISKLFDPRAFAATLSHYDLVPEILLPAVAFGLPVIEIIAGLALAADRPWGLHITSGLLLLFVLVLGYGILGDLNVDCGCFGAEELDKQAALRLAFYRDLALIGLVAPYLYFSRRVRAPAASRDGR